MIRKWMANNEVVAMLLALAVISGIVYLPLTGQLGYMNDDWYLMYSAGAYGSKVFIDIFSVDRPARALVMIPAYSLFGGYPLYYNLSAYIFRLVSAMALMWTLRMLFPRQHSATFLASLLFLIYPGFLSQPNGIDYQSHLLGLAAAQISIALTIKTILVEHNKSKAISLVLSVLFGLLYLSQMEWYIGFELFRWGCVFLLSSRIGGSLLQKAWRAFRLAYPTLVIPGIFLIWRIFFFQGERTATDVNVQFEQVMLYPVQTLYHWTIQVLQDLFDVMFSAWAIPFLQLRGYIHGWGIALAIVIVCLVFYVLFSYKNNDEQEMQAGNYTREAFMLGLFIAVGGLIPVVMVNREVSFPSYSRYTLVSSAGVVLFLSAALALLKQRFLRNGLIALLVIVSSLTHHANTVKAVWQTSLTREFWWQVSWRVPQFEKSTTLIVSYPDVALEEDYFIWGPANLIYYPEKQNEKYIQPGLYAAIPNRETEEKILARERQEYDKRKNIITYTNYRNILVLTQPSINSCVHLLDGTQTEFSQEEGDFIREVGSYSEIEHVLEDETHHTPPTVVFGSEPDHGWCYYYQKADLARQRGEWDEVHRIGEQAFGQGFEPKDLIEWIPFLQAYAVSGNVDRLEELARVVTVDPNISRQVCRILRGMNVLSTEVLEKIDSIYCLE